MALDIDMRDSGHQSTEIKRIANLNLTQMVVDGGLAAADYPPLYGGIVEFRLRVKAMGVQLESDLGAIPGLSSGDIEKVSSWSGLRDYIGQNFEATDAVVNP